MYIIQHPGEHSTDLQFISKLTISNNDCASRLGSFGTIVDSKLCAFNFENDFGAWGDSGGPLTQNDFQIIGVLSWGVSCARGFPDVYTRVSSFRSWISLVTGV